MKGRQAEKSENTGWVEALKEDFRQGSARIMESHFGGAGGMAVVRAITAHTDRLLSSVFAKVCGDSGLRPQAPGWSLVAVGGYGRGELNPHSDVDIMFLGQAGSKDKGGELPAGVLHVLWDLGLTIGYSVRRSDDCRSLARKDFTIMTSLMEARLISGDKAVFKDFADMMAGEKRPKAVEEFIREKLAERAKRHKKYGDSVFLREPNIKEGAGGLRDIHAALWISRIKYGVDTLPGLVEKGIIKERDLRRLKGARDYLLRLRNELHYISGHRQDILTYDLQETAAKDFGYTPRPNRMAVENFMRAYYIRARGVREVTQGIIESSLDRSKGRLWAFFPPTKRKVNDDFMIIGRSLCLAGDPKRTFSGRPEALVEAFSLSKSYGAPMSDMLRDAVSDNIKHIDRTTRESKKAGGIFLDMLGSLDRLHETLDLMHKMKALGRLLPEFGAVYAMVQHDMYHWYTVDEHSLLAVKKVEGLQKGDGLAYPEFRDALIRVKDRQVLLLAVLMHDTGKASGHGHAERGARLALGAALRLGMDEARAGKVEFLVRNHLLMAHVSQRRELSDPKVMEKFCRIVDSQELLDMLYLLTYADVSTVGPELFNDWKMMLLKELYERASAFLKDSVSVVAYEKERIGRLGGIIAAEVESRKAGKAGDVAKFLANLPGQYLLTVPADLAARQFELTRGIKGGDVVIHHEHDRRGYTNLTVILHDVMGLFASCAGTLSAHNMNILSAQVFTGRDGIVIDTFQVTDYNKKPALDEDLWKKVKADLLRVLRGQESVERLMPSRPAYPRRTALTNVPVRVVVDNEVSDRFTVLEVYAPDRVGLLYDITRTLYGFGYYISSARVDTEVDQVVDVFYVTDIFRQKVEDKDRIKAITDALTKALAGEGE